MRYTRHDLQGNISNGFSINVKTHEGAHGVVMMEMNKRMGLAFCTMIPTNISASQKHRINCAARSIGYKRDVYDLSFDRETHRRQTAADY